MKELDEKLKRMLFQDCKNKVQDFNEICNYISQYSQANIFIIPRKYYKTIQNELDDLINKNHLPILYEFRDADDDENSVILTLYNFGVMQREQLIKELGK